VSASSPTNVYGPDVTPTPFVPLLVPRHDCCHRSPARIVARIVTDGGSHVNVLVLS
jgi:hypothetical protein